MGRMESVIGELAMKRPPCNICGGELTYYPGSGMGFHIPSDPDDTGHDWYCETCLRGGVILDMHIAVPEQKQYQEYIDFVRKQVAEEIQS